MKRSRRAHYVADKFTAKGGNKYSAAGKLTLRNMTRDVPIEFTFERKDGSAWLKGSAKIKRLDFGVGQGEWKDTSTVGNDVKVRFVLLLATVTGKPDLHAKHTSPRATSAPRQLRLPLVPASQGNQWRHDSAAPLRYTGPDECVEATLSRVGKHVVLGLPVAIGKPNSLVNAFVARAVADPLMRLTIVTALSLRKPRGHSDLERRLIEPLARACSAIIPSWNTCG